MEQNNLNQHIDWIDGAKGVAILCVILEHCLPDLDVLYSRLHIGQSVPIFVFITAYLISSHYKSLSEYFTKQHLIKMCRAIFPPFLIVLLCESIIYYIQTGQFFHLKSLLLSGGCFGPGSYYLCLYLLLWVICPLIAEMVRRIPLWMSFVILLIIAVAGEFGVTLLVNVSHISSLYSLVPIRYLMIMWLGSVFMFIDSKAKILLILLALISGVAIVMSCYVIEIQRVITPPYWKGNHWYTNLYCLLPILLLQRIQYTEGFIWLGKHSWLIFCFQMFVFWCVRLQ